MGRYEYQCNGGFQVSTWSEVVAKITKRKRKGGTSLPIKNLTTRQETAKSTDELQRSYNRLYQEWLGSYHNIDLYQQILGQLGVSSGKLLDIACGLGDLLALARSRGASPYGIDISRVALEKAKQAHPYIFLVEGDGEYLPWPDNFFDYITCIGSLEHFIHPEKGAQEIARVLKPTGLAAINLPNSHHIQAIYNVYKTGSILPELQDYERFATRHEWESFLEENHLRVVQIHKFNTGFGRVFKEGRESFWYLYNILYHTLGDCWIPLNLSFTFTFICAKKK